MTVDPNLDQNGHEGLKPEPMSIFLGPGRALGGHSEKRVLIIIILLIEQGQGLVWLGLHAILYETCRIEQIFLLLSALDGGFGIGFEMESSGAVEVL